MEITVIETTTTKKYLLEALSSRFELTGEIVGFKGGEQKLSSVENRKKNGKDRAGMELGDPWNSTKRVSTSVMSPYRTAAIEKRDCCILVKLGGKVKKY